MRMEMTKSLEKSVRKHGSVLKAFRAQGGGGAGMMAGGITLLICGVLLGLVCLLAVGANGLLIGAFFGVPGLLLVLFGMRSRNKRLNNYLDFYEKDTGYSREELQQADRELMSPDAVKIGGKMDNSGGRAGIIFMVTDHYFLTIWPVYGAHLRKLDDIVAAFYSAQIPGIGGYRQDLFVISRQETAKKGEKNPFTKKEYQGFECGLMTEQRHCQQTCAEVLEEMVKRAPHIITSQNIAVNGVPYNLLSMDNWQADWVRILGE